MSWRGLALVSSISMSLALTGCGSTATLVRSGGREPVRGRIERSTDVELCLADGGGQLLGVSRREVEAIHHPGRFLMAAGVVYLVIGAVFTALWASAGGAKADGPQAAALTGGFGMIGFAVGTPLVAWGGYQHLRSRRAAASWKQGPCARSAGPGAALVNTR